MFLFTNEKIAQIREKLLQRKRLTNIPGYGKKIFPKNKPFINQIIAMKQGSPKLHNSKIGGSQFGVTYVHYVLLSRK